MPGPRVRLRDLYRRLGEYNIGAAVPSGLPAGAPVMVLARYPSGQALDAWVAANDNRVYNAYYNDDGVPWTGWYPVDPRRA